MKMLFLTAGLNAPSSRFRAHQFIERLERKGVSVTVKAADEGRTSAARVFNRALGTLSAAKYDLVFLQKPSYALSAGSNLNVLLKTGAKLVFDFDDAVFIDHETGEWRDKKTLDALRAILEKSAAVIAGNDYLASFAGKYSGNVHVIPTVIDTDKYVPLKKDKKDGVTIGWIGTRQNLEHLLYIKGALLEVLERPGRDLSVVSNMAEKDFHAFFDAKGAPVSYRVWSAEKELEYLNQFDIGLMPLVDTPYARGKCGFKLIQYMSVGIPAIASPVGVNSDIVADGITGFHARSVSQWVLAMETLSADGELRSRMGDEGRKRVERSFSVDAVFPKLYEVIRQVSGYDK